MALFLSKGDLLSGYIDQIQRYKGFKEKHYKDQVVKKRIVNETQIDEKPAREDNCNRPCINSTEWEF